MIVLHANWVDASLRIWGERAEAKAPAPENGQGAPTHPFAAPVEELTTLVSALAPDVSITPGEPIELLLPTWDDQPTPSPRLAHAMARESAPEGEATLSPWSAPTLRIDAADAAHALQELELAARRRERENGHSHAPFALGPGVEFFAAAARIARSAVAEQRFVPMLVQQTEGAMRSSWRLWPADDITASRLRDLIGAMPPIARAARDTQEHDAWSIVDDFSCSIVDQSVRRALSADSMIEAIDGRDPASDDAVAWLAGLLASPTESPVPVERRPTFMRNVRRWIGGLEDRGSDSEWRLRLELSEPLSAGEGQTADLTWTLRLGLASTDDPEARIDAVDIFLMGGDTTVIEGRRLDDARQLLLSEMARAARIYAKLEGALREAEPTHIELDTKDAYIFLREIAPLLDEQGFAVSTPGWWGQPGARLGVRLKIDSPQIETDGPPRGEGAGVAVSQLGLDALVDYRWEIAVGDTTLTLKEFESLAAQRVPLVKVDGAWIEIRPEDVQAASSFIRDNPGGKMSVTDTLRLTFSWDEKHTGVPILGVEASGWAAGLFGVDDARLPMLEQPEGFQGALRPYQLTGLSWLRFLDRLGLGACLADDMGLGKTIQVIAMLLHEREVDGVRNETTLVIAPTSVVENWQREIRRFGPSLRVLVHHGPERATGAAFAQRASENDVIITTYALAHRDREDLKLVDWRRVILDEAQNIKNHASKQSQSVRSLSAPRRIVMTGTPVENRLSELWSIMDFCNPGHLGAAAEFRRRFAAPIERHHDRSRSRQLRSLVQPFILRRLKTDPMVTADLPEKVESKEYCRLTREQAALYETTVKQMLSEADRTEGIQRRGAILASLIKLKQICNHPSQLLRDYDYDSSHPPQQSRSAKCQRLIELLDEAIAAGDQALIFTQFRQMGRLLARMLTSELDREVLFMHGGTPQKVRQQMIDRFQRADGTAPIFLLSLKAGGVGLNLTAANHVFHFDRWWNPAVENQATDRAFRIGQTRTVQVHKFIVAGTLEERIDKMIEQKTELAETVIGSGEDWLTELTTSQLRDLVSLRSEAVEDDE